MTRESRTKAPELNRVLVGVAVSLVIVSKLRRRLGLVFVFFNRRQVFYFKVADGLVSKGRHDAFVFESRVDLGPFLPLGYRLLRLELVKLKLVRFHI